MIKYEKGNNWWNVPVWVLWCALRCELFVYTLRQPLNWHLWILRLGSGDSDRLLLPLDDETVLKLLILTVPLSVTIPPMLTATNCPTGRLTNRWRPSSGDDGGVSVASDIIRAALNSDLKGSHVIVVIDGEGESSPELSHDAPLELELRLIVSNLLSLHSLSENASKSQSFSMMTRSWQGKINLFQGFSGSFIRLSRIWQGSDFSNLSISRQCCTEQEREEIGNIHHFILSFQTS